MLLICTISIFSQTVLMSQDILINQKSGIYQGDRRKQVSFYETKEIKTDPTKLSIGQVNGIRFFDNKIFILDGKQGKVLVLDNNADYLCSIGQPGQGPGDLEYPADFEIANDSRVFVLNSMARRIEILGIKGEFQKRINLAVPKEIYFSYPVNFCINPDETLSIAYNLSPNLVDLYGADGAYVSHILSREGEISLPGVNLGNSSQIRLFDKGKAILHFDTFRGVFTKVGFDKKIKAVFSAYDSYQNKEVARIMNNIKN